jgi:uncharacterized membrane protein
MSGHSDLERVILAAALGALLSIVLPWELLRLLVALPLALVLPGYAIVLAAFGTHELRRPQLWMLTLACSLCVLVLGGILLNYLPGGIRGATWALLLLVVVLAACRAAALRRPRTWRRPRRSKLSLGAIRRLDLACGGLAALAAVAALVFAYAPLSAGGAAGYTALWMLPGRGGDSGKLRVGIESAEQRSLEYFLRVRTGGGHSKVARFSLDPGEETGFTLPLALRRGARERITASLYRIDHPHRLYRRVVLWLPKRGEGL